MKRASGVLLHITSLPSPYGVGTLGKSAYQFCDYLHRAAQSFWQLLPVTPTSYGDSPYQSPSSFAGNPYLIDLDILKEEGLLTQEEIGSEWGADPRHADFGFLYEKKYAVLRKAYEKYTGPDPIALISNRPGMDTWLLFAALKKYFNGAQWSEWPEDIRKRYSYALDYYNNLLKDEIRFQAFLQMKFEEQWSALKSYAESRNIQFIGDIPIYVPYDSAEVWERPDLFMLDNDGKQLLKAGCPPDAFTELGQLWGNPVYNWEKHEVEGFAWWKQRVLASAGRFDLIRIDHFRGLESFWAVPQWAPDARPGQWYRGPGMKLVSALYEAGMKGRIIAEDLGFLTAEVKKLLNDAGCPGMRVMQFGFDPLGNSRELPHNYVKNSVVYLGTHDNCSIMEWFETAPASDAAFAVDYLGLNKEEGFAYGFIRGLMTSCADLAIVQIQDVLSMGKGNRMNYPGSTGWWTWRLLPNELNDDSADRLAYYTYMSGRAEPKRR